MIQMLLGLVAGFAWLDRLRPADAARTDPVAVPADDAGAEAAAEYHSISLPDVLAMKRQQREQA